MGYDLTCIFLNLKEAMRNILEHFFTRMVLLVVLTDFLKSSPPLDVVLLESVFACLGR